MPVLDRLWRRRRLRARPIRGAAGRAPRAGSHSHLRRPDGADGGRQVRGRPGEAGRYPRPAGRPGPASRGAISERRPGLPFPPRAATRLSPWLWRSPSAPPRTSTRTMPSCSRRAPSSVSLLAEHTGSEGSVTVGVHSHCVFVGKARVRTTVSTYGRFAYLIQLFESWNISTLTFFEDLTKEELMQVVRLLARERRDGIRGSRRHAAQSGSGPGAGGHARGGRSAPSHRSSGGVRGRHAGERRDAGGLSDRRARQRPPSASRDPGGGRPDPARSAVAGGSHHHQGFRSLSHLPLHQRGRAFGGAGPTTGSEQVEAGRAVSGRLSPRCRQA